MVHWHIQDPINQVLLELFGNLVNNLAINHLRRTISFYRFERVQDTILWF